MTMKRVLTVGLERETRRRFVEMIEAAGLAAEAVSTLDEALEVFEHYTPSVILIDSGEHGNSAMDALATLPIQAGQVVVVLDDDEEGSLSDALGGTEQNRFHLLARTADEARVSKLLRSLREREDCVPDESPKTYGAMLGNCLPMREVYYMMAKVAPTEATVLINGQSGTGKELVAYAIHKRSERHDKPYLAINCGAIALTLIESELFGHEKGSFTGADKQRPGVFEQADGGTLFLDEITELPAEAQVRLLRVIENGTLRRVGGQKEIKVNVRVIAATNRDPKKAVESGDFRADVMYRLAVFPISLPRLADRGDDVLLLANHFLAQHNLKNCTSKHLSDRAISRLYAYDWPGNVRQLRNVIHRAYILEKAEIHLDCVADLIAEHIDVESIPRPTLTPAGIEPTDPDGLTANPGSVTVEVGTTIDAAERQLILKTLARYSGNKTEAAKILGISVKTLYNRLNQYGIDY